MPDSDPTDVDHQDEVIVIAPLRRSAGGVQPSEASRLTSATTEKEHHEPHRRNHR